MIEKLIRLDNVGVFKNGVPTAVDFGKVTLVYAENGRGKSTLAATLSSLATGDPTTLLARQTFGAGLPDVRLRCGPVGQISTVRFDGSKWDGRLPEVVVFDQQFVEKNVYAGSDIQSSHHEALLDFALGSAAVQLKTAVHDASEEQTSATRRRSTAEDKLKGFLGGLPLQAFLKLAKNDRVAEEIQSLELRIAAAQSAEAISKRSLLSALEPPDVHFGRVKAVLESSLENIHATAEAQVLAHVAHLSNASTLLSGVETQDWLATGFTMMHDEKCPFCTQSTDGVVLVQTYKSFFDAAYEGLTEDVRALEDTLADAVDPGGLAGYEKTHSLNEERIVAWSEQLLLKVDSFDARVAREKVAKAMYSAEQLVQQKQTSPLKGITASSLDMVEQEVLNALEVIETYNAQVEAANAIITDYKQRLATEKLDELRSSLRALQSVKTRYSTEVQAIVDERSKADDDRKAAERRKQAAREQLDVLMTGLLQRYQQSINRWLARFGASFTVAQLKPTYVGPTGTPRTEYGIDVRGTTIAAAKKTTGASFQTALSDGDKRTLALAFFLAKLLESPDIGKTTVVVDDIFTSLDKHRRAQTVDAILDMAQGVEQLLVLAHDAYFLRDVFRKLKAKGLGEATLLHATYAPDDFSELKLGLDFDDLCATDFYKHYAALQNFLAGTGVATTLAVAQGLRPLLEGHLHRRFPGHISEGDTVGAVIGSIKGKQSPSPLVVLQPHVKALHDLNDFAAAFHHDTSGIAPRTSVTVAELRTYGQRFMELLHTGYPPA